MSEKATTSPTAPPSSSDEPGQRSPESDRPAPDEPLSRPDAPAPLQVDLNLEVDDVRPPLAGWLDDQVARIAAVAGVDGGNLNITVVNDAVMADLHERYKSVPGTTDVLTFDLRDEADAPMEGDVVVCLDEAARQAAERGHETRVEALLYAVHGLLHLLGEDDDTEEAAAQMHRREDELLTAAGFGRVFAGGGG